MSPEAYARSTKGSAEVGEGMTVVAATKYVALDDMRVLAVAGIDVVGENREQDLARKRAATATHFRWHFIGHLQSNKAKVVNGCASCALARLRPAAEPP